MRYSFFIETNAKLHTTWHINDQAEMGTSLGTLKVLTSILNYSLTLGVPPSQQSTQNQHRRKAVPLSEVSVSHRREYNTCARLILNTTGRAAEDTTMHLNAFLISFNPLQIASQWQNFTKSINLFSLSLVDRVLPQKGDGTLERSS